MRVRKEESQKATILKRRQIDRAGVSRTIAAHAANVSSLNHYMPYIGVLSIRIDTFHMAIQNLIWVKKF